MPPTSATPLANRMTIASRNKMATLTNVRAPPSLVPVRRPSTVTKQYPDSLRSSKIDLEVKKPLPQKFPNPIEAQRQLTKLRTQVTELEKTRVDRQREVDKLKKHIAQVSTIGAGYATAVQYLAVKLKLDSDKDLVTECDELRAIILNLEAKLESIEDDYKNHLTVEHDLRNNLQMELNEERTTHSNMLEKLATAHQAELDDLNQKHSEKLEQLNDRIQLLESQLRERCKELNELKKDHENLNIVYNKLEESLKKDKDARVKYAQEKVIQLQKDVESLNTVLEMRSERVHALEKDSLMLIETQSELLTQKDMNKALNHQIESLNAALEKKRDQYENLVLDHEKIRQELKRERKERRRMTMRTEQLEFVLEESCASENSRVFNSSMRDMDNADPLT